MKISVFKKLPAITEIEKSEFYWMRIKTYGIKGFNKRITISS